MYNKSIVYKISQGYALAMIACLAKNLKIYIAVLLLSALLASCTLVKKPFELKKHAVKYAETLYKRQNQATQRVMMLLEEDVTLAEEESLSAAELKMYDDCQLLNEVANREREGKAVSLYFQKQVQNSFDACDDSVTKMELLLKQVDEKIQY